MYYKSNSYFQPLYSVCANLYGSIAKNKMKYTPTELMTPIIDY